MKSIKIFNRSIQLLNVVFGTHILYRRLRCRDTRICSVKEKQYVLFTIVINQALEHAFWALTFELLLNSISVIVFI